VLYDHVIVELDHYLKNNEDPDYFTFSGAGEPTLNIRIGDVLSYLKSNAPEIPVAVLTNGTLLYDPVVRSELAGADLVLPSLDAASEPVYQKINRPAKGLNIDGYIAGLISFRKEFKGEIWLEVMIIPGYNDYITELQLLKNAIKKIKPDRIQLNTLDRPGTKEDITRASYNSLKNIVKMWGLENVEIIASVPERKDLRSYRQDIESAILETISRRPCTLDDLQRILGIHSNEINKYLGVLEGERKIDTVLRERGVFYRLND
jgi:wyosine [tRNA(Phe)-imidazoG37] synthetase (radical SAM superfamily)